MFYCKTTTNKTMTSLALLFQTNYTTQTQSLFLKAYAPASYTRLFGIRFHVQQ